MRYLISLIALLALASQPLTLVAGPGHDEPATHADTDAETGHGDGDEHGEEEAEGHLEMDAEARARQGIVTAPVRRQRLSALVTAPAEVTLNLYRSAQVTPRIPAQVVARHARLGDSVKPGQKLVTLSSVDMADAQGALLIADREWQRVRKLGRKVVSERRYIEAQVARQQAYARVLAYGMSERQIDALLREAKLQRADGSFDLSSPIEGRVISDAFVVGELAKPGTLLFEITDESRLWVEARVSAEQAAEIDVGAAARVRTADGNWVEGRVIQRHHRLDETTRTLAIRIEVDNREDRLHPGEFLEVAIETRASAPVVAVPESAVVLFQGAPAVFKLEGDELHPQPVEIGPQRAGYVLVEAGLEPGEEVVVKGAFLLKSLLLKSQMGEGHAH